MNKTVVRAAVAGFAVAATVATPGLAGAIPPSGSAADVVQALQDQGYSVQFNGIVHGPLSRCSVTGVHGLVVMMMQMDQANPGDVFVDVSCPSSNN